MSDSRLDGGHDAAHEGLLEELLEGRLEPSAERARALLASCGRCAARWRERESLLGELGRAGAWERELLQGLGAPVRLRAEGHIAEWLAVEVEREKLSRSRRLTRRGLAAALLLGIGALGWRALAPRADPGPEILDAEQGEALAPVGLVAGVDAFSEFRWRLPLPPGGYYRVEIHPLGADGEQLPPVESGKLIESSWRPDAEQSPRWSAIRWSVHAYPRERNAQPRASIEGVEARRSSSR